MTSKRRFNSSKSSKTRLRRRKTKFKFNLIIRLRYSSISYLMGLELTRMVISEIVKVHLLSRLRTPSRSFCS